MGRLWWAMIVAGCAAGCVIPDDERIRDYNEDGIYLYRQEKYFEARQSFEAALALKPDDPALLYNIGACSDHRGQYSKAEASYRACLERAPNHTECRHALVVLLVSTNRRAEAEQMVTDWLAREPKLAAPYTEDAWLSHQAGDLPRAQGRLQQALEIDPHYVPALTELGLVYESMKRPERALALYQRALEKDPKQVEVTERVNYLLAKGTKMPKPE